jgi:anaerobic ribonucleoside-triphosphate reductase activating protein
VEPDGIQDIRIGLIHFPLLSLGPGLRTGIWFSGCPLGCEGCIAPEWQDRASGYQTTVAALLAELHPFLQESDGVTISGGEPFAQPDGLTALLRGLRKKGITDIIAYSGYPLAQLAQTAPEALALLDVLVDGPFMADQSTDSPWRGSANQQLHILTDQPLLQQRYRQFAHHIPGRRLLQCIPRTEGATLIGIPRSANLEDLRYGTV